MGADTAAAVGVIAESDLSGNTQHEYIFFGGRRVARKRPARKHRSYYFSDHLHSASVITDSSGNIKAESDYRAFGAELQFVNNDSNDYKFTGKKRDLETWCVRSRPVGGLFERGVRSFLMENKGIGRTGVG